MGLAAGQARLLSITGRKSDCEFASMRISHQKIALARDLANLSNEYQNSINQTKIVYDYYGKGDTSVPLTYGILMTPSTLNNYMPTTLTDSLGRVVLNSKYAEAARAAGIPQEGLGTLPSENMRNQFIKNLYGTGLITERLANTIISLPYSQGAGFGGDVTVAMQTTEGNINDLIEYLDKNCTNQYHYESPIIADNESESWIEGKRDEMDTLEGINISDLLSGDNEISITFQSDKNEGDIYTEASAVASYLLDTFIPWMEETLGSVLNIDSSTDAAFEYANREIANILLNNISDPGKEEKPPIYSLGGRRNSTKVLINDIEGRNDAYMGFTSIAQRKSWGSRHGRNSVGSINLNNLAQAYLTLFAKMMDGVAQKDADGTPKYNVVLGSRDNNKLVTDDTLFNFIIKTGSDVASDDLGQAMFYDTLFNQICANGWTENNNIEDKDYLQEMLQSGMVFISKMKDDGFYYQGNYATDNYIKVVSDETKIAQAEAKYATEKAKLNAKEETLDLKMKNLDTEISSLTTEYDTVKNTLSKNIEKSFKRYNA